MNNIQKGLLTLMVAGIASASFVGCDEDDTFDINSPDWLSSRIDSIADAKANQAGGDTVKVELSSAEYGEKDNSSAWWTDFSDAVAIPSGKMLTFEFDNYGSGANNWNNWNLCVANSGNREGDSYAEYFVLRSDMYGWGGDLEKNGGYAYDAANISSNYADVAAEAGAEDMWAFFREKIEGSHVVMKIQHVAAGYCYVTATMTAKDGTVLIEEYRQTCSPADDIYAFLVCDGSHFEKMSAYITPAEIVITESNPARLELANTPAFLTLGDTAYHTGVTAKVYFEDGTSADVDTLDLSFVAPDLSTVGSKTVTVIYNKTSRGNYCAPVYASYTLAVTDFKAIRVEPVKNVNYFIPAGETAVPVIANSVKVYGISSDDSETILDNAYVEFSTVNDKGVFSATYQGLSANATVGVTTGCEQFGASDFSTGWWTVFAPDEQVAQGQTVTKTVQIRSDNVENWHCPVVVLRNAALGEYAVLRADNFGWGSGYASATLESNWNWDTFKANLDGSVYTIEVTNNGATIDVKMTIIDAAGEEHFQNFIGISTTGEIQPADADDVYVSLTCEASYLVVK